MRSRRAAGIVLTALLVVAMTRVATTARVFSPTIDEPGHIASGFQWLATDRYDVDIEHPPLARIFFAIEPWLEGAEVRADLARVDQGNALLHRGDRDRHNIAVARAGNLIWLLVALVSVFAWTKRLAGTNAALLAVALLGALPPILAHAGVATTDMAVAAMTVAALFLFDRWLDQPTWPRALAFAIALGAGALSKFSFVLFFPLGAIVLLRRKWIPIPQIVAVAFTSALCVFAVYEFEAERLPDIRIATLPPQAPEHIAAKYAQVPGYEWVRPDLIRRYHAYCRLGTTNVDFVDWAKATGYPSPLAGRHGNTMAGAPPLPQRSLGDRLLEPFRRAGQWIAHRVPVPAPAFFLGVQRVRTHSTLGHPAFLLGERSETGWWYYFPVVLFFKTPLPFLLFAIAGMVALRKPIALAPLLMLAAAMTSRINIGVRHLLPMFPLLAILAAIGVVALWRRTRAGTLALLLWYFVATAIAHPDYLAYFNELVGRHPERIAADSNLDWGQDLFRLADVARRERLEPLYVSYFGTAPWQRYLPHAHPIPETPVNGWIAVSEEHWIREHDRALQWLAREEPVRRIGASIRLYHVTSR